MRYDRRGNAGMTKGGTGDVLAGLVAALYCKNEAFLSACAGSYINKKQEKTSIKKLVIISTPQTSLTKFRR